MYYFRADANEQTGAGHMMRCLTIAQALRADCLFVCADEASAALPKAQGFETHILHTDYRDMEAELPALTALLQRGETKETLIVDSYRVTDTYLAVLRAFARVVLIDDNMEHAHPADMIINYNFHADLAAYKTLYTYGSAAAAPALQADDGTKAPGQDLQTGTEEAAAIRQPFGMAVFGDTRFLTGPQVAPVRKQFANCAYDVRTHAAHILVLAGGSDPANAAGAIYRALSEAFAQAGKERPAITVVCGRYSPHRAELEAQAKQDAHLRVLYDVEDMAALMCEADVCVSACGSTVYELCAVGLPFVCFSLFDNQEKLAAFLEEKGPVPYCGAFHYDAQETVKRIVAETIRLFDDADARREQCAAQRGLVDGDGAARIARVLGETGD